MPVAKKNNDCKPCIEDASSSKIKKYAGWISGFLIIILPKCPFCFMAFTSTMLLCGEGSTMVSERIYQSSSTIFLSGNFCLAAVSGILWVRRDIRTIYALLLALAGSAMVMTSVVWGGGIPLYYAGASIIFLGVWLNSSLLFLLHKMGISSGIEKWPGSNLFSLQTKNK
jgi:hypothetical protein